MTVTNTKEKSSIKEKSFLDNIYQSNESFAPALIASIILELCHSH